MAKIKDVIKILKEKGYEISDLGIDDPSQLEGMSEAEIFALLSSLGIKPPFEDELIFGSANKAKPDADSIQQTSSGIQVTTALQAEENPDEIKSYGVAKPIETLLTAKSAALPNLEESGIIQTENFLFHRLFSDFERPRSDIFFSLQTNLSVGINAPVSYADFTGSLFADNIATWSMSIPTGNLIIYALDDDDYVEVPYQEYEYIIYGGDGADTMYGYQGGIDLGLPFGRTIFYGDAGDDSIYAGYYNTDIVYGGDGNDTLSTYSYAEIYGEAGNDRIEISGIEVSALFSGGIGADTFAVEGYQFMGSSTYVAQTILDFNPTEGDVLHFNATFSDLYVPGHSEITDFIQLTEVGNDTIVSLSYNGVFSGYDWFDTLILKNITGLDINTLIAGGNLTGAATWETGTSGNDVANVTPVLYGYNRYYGGDGDDVITGDPYTPWTGRNGNDFISGGAGNDTIYGNTGGFNDRLYGGDGDDTIYSGTAFGVSMWGGAGNDTMGDSNATSKLQIFYYEADTTFGYVDTLTTDFGAPGAYGDKINIKDVLHGFYDPLSDAIADYVRFVDAGANSHMEIDQDGLANGANFVHMATLLNMNGLDATALESSGNLVTA